MLDLISRKRKGTFFIKAFYRGKVDLANLYLNEMFYSQKSVETGLVVYKNRTLAGEKDFCPAQECCPAEGNECEKEEKDNR